MRLLNKISSELAAKPIHWYFSGLWYVPTSLSFSTIFWYIVLMWRPSWYRISISIISFSKLFSVRASSVPPSSWPLISSYSRRRSSTSSSSSVILSIRCLLLYCNRSSFFLLILMALSSSPTAACSHTNKQVKQST